MMLKTHLYPLDEAFTETLTRYLGETLHDDVKVEKHGGTINVPMFLKQSYHFYNAWVIGKQCLLIAPKANADTPANIAKHVSLVRSAVNTVVIFAAPSLTPYNRSRLLNQGVAFVVPGNQLYVPEFAMDLREHFRAPKSQHTESLTPAAQAVMFHHLLRLGELAPTPSAIAGRLRYSPMSIGRAFDNLVAMGLATTKKHGRERHLYFNADGQDLMEFARPLLHSPVRTVKYIRGNCPPPDLKIAGETALAALTALAPPSIKTFAILASDWKTICETFDIIEADECENGFAVETWSYDPAGLSDGPAVDPLSLYAQFWDHRDERIAIAAKELLENIEW